MNLGEILSKLFLGLDNEQIEAFKVRRISSYEEQEEKKFSLDKFFQFKMENGSDVTGKLNEEFLIFVLYELENIW